MPRPKYHLPPTITFTQEDNTQDVFICSRELGHGSFSVVYNVIHQSTGNTYAMKAISKKRYSRNKFLLRNLNNEVAIQKIVNHPNVVTSKFTFSDKNYHYLVLEYCPGKSIRDYLNKSLNYHLNEPETRKIIKDVIQGLIYIHSQQITHYDIKLENFIIDSKGNVKIGDFGLSSFSENEKGKKFEIFGSLNYISPEMLRKEYREESQKVDVWAIGVSTFILLTGKPPFEGETKEITFRNILNGNFKFPIDFPISENAKDFVRKILQSDPRKRPAAKDLLHHPFLTKIDKETVILYRSIFLPPIKSDIKTSQKVQGEVPQVNNKNVFQKETKEELKQVCSPTLSDRKVISPKQPNSNLKQVCSPPPNCNKANSLKEELKQVCSPTLSDRKVISPKQSNSNLKQVCSPTLSDRKENYYLKPVCCPPPNCNKAVSPRRSNLKPVCSPPFNENNFFSPRRPNSNSKPF